MKAVRPSTATFLASVTLLLVSFAPGASLQANETLGEPQADEGLVLAPDPFAILGRSTRATPPFVDVTEVSAPLAEPFGALIEAAREDPGGALARLRDSNDPLSSAPGSPIVIAALELRIAAPSNRVALREALRATQGANALPEFEPWVALELARADLALGWYPEAAAAARRAWTTGGEQGYSEPFRDAAELLRAEAFHLAGRSAVARPIYDRLAGSDWAPARTAASLRRIDLRFDRGEDVSYDEALGRASALGMEVGPWWPRSAEAAIRAGDSAAAEEQLLRFLEGSTPSRATALAEVRLADLLVARGEVDAARDRLAAVEAGHEGLPVGLLAGIRLARLDFEDGDHDAARARLVAAADSDHVGVSAYANALRGRAALERGQLDDALHALGRASRANADNPLAKETRADLVLAAKAAVAVSYEEGGCLGLILRLTVRRRHLADLLSEPEPFVRLGACYQEIGLHETAYELFRSIPRIFGPQVAGVVAFPLARSALVAGEVKATRTRALAYAVQPDAPVEWTLLLAEASLAGGDPKPAVEVLAPLVREGGAADGDPRALGLLARAAFDGEADAEIYALLERRLVGLADGPEPESAEVIGEAALSVATALRRSGEDRRARKLYAIAGEHLPQGWRLAETAYWLARLEPGNPSERFDRELVPARHPGESDVLRLVEHARGLAALRERHQRPVDPGSAEESSR